MVMDTWGEYNSVIHIPNIPFYRLIAQALFSGLLVLLVISFFIEPIIYHILHWRLAFRYKLMMSTIIIIIASNCVFMLYNMRESRELIKQGIIDNVNLVHLMLSGRQIDFLHLNSEREHLHNALADFFWNSKTRVEKFQASPYQVTLSDLAFLDTNYRLIYLSHRKQNSILQAKRAQRLGYQNSEDFFMQGVFAKAIQASQAQIRLGDTVFAQPNDEVIAAEPLETRQGHFFLGYGTFVKPIFIQGKLVGFYAGAIQSKLYGGEIARIFYTNLAIIILIALVSIFLLGNIGRVITHYLSELANWTQQIIKGNLSGRISIKSGDELQTLAENFDAMRASLEASFSQIAEKNSRLLHEAYYDSLTALPNRKKMALDLLQSPCQGLVLINVDDFRGLNDFFGTDTGDSILKEIAQRLEQISAAQEFALYKVGADEFVLTFANNSHINTPNTILALAKDISDAIANYCYLINQNEIYVSVTCGIALAQTTAAARLLFSQAANAMRIAKQRKLAQLLYDPSMEEEHAFEQNMTWANKIKQAIDDDRIVIYYQPIVRNDNREIIKYECLVRLLEKNGKVISPYVFLEIAKQARLYPFITQIVVAKAFSNFAESPLDFSINLSIDDIIDSNTQQFIFATMRQYPNAARRVVFEIIETAEIQNYQVLRDFITQVKALGGRIAIDDFGSGYSNFAHVMSMNIDYLKIDGSLIRHLDQDPNAQIISQTIADFGKKLGIKTIAEFVHSELIYQKVVAYGIDLSQGYYFGEPVPSLPAADQPQS